MTTVPGLYVLDSDGRPVREPDIAKWGRWRATHDCQVARSEIGDITVSTVFLGLDHRHFGDGPPVLWETMVFGLPDYEAGHGPQWRHVSRDLAETRHLAVVDAIRAGRLDQLTR